MLHSLVLLLVCLQPPDTKEPPLAPAAPPTVQDILKIRGQIAELVAKEATMRAAYDKENAKLGIPPSPGFSFGRPGKDGKDGHSPVVAWGLPGTPDFDRLSIDGKFTGPHLTGPKGDPAPIPPGPNPPDPPSPTADKLWLVVLEETADRTAITGAVLGDLTFWNSLKPLGHGFSKFDQNDPGTAAQSYVARFADLNKARIAAGQEALKLPVLFIMDVAKPVGSNMVKVIPLPGTTAEIRAQIKSITGK
jgi:hypothetical protein